MTKAKIIVCAVALLPWLAVNAAGVTEIAGLSAGIYVIEGQKIVVMP